jgi:hypothetical protein
MLKIINAGYKSALLAPVRNLQSYLSGCRFHTLYRSKGLVVDLFLRDAQIHAFSVETNFSKGMGTSWFKLAHLEQLWFPDEPNI